MKTLVTAFGPFAGRAENASSLALHEIRKRMPALSTRILPVDMVAAPARLRQALRSIRPDLLIMLGEAAGSKAIRLETTAWNELDFSIPDIAGRQPRGKKISAQGPPALKTPMDWQAALSELLTEKHACVLSDDPGRYLCNQVYHVALDFAARERPSLKAGFIHLPLAADYPTVRSADAVARVLDRFSVL